MTQITKGDTFADGQQVTGARLNQLIDSATILPTVITDQTAVLTGTSANTASTDLLLIYNQATSALRKATISDVVNTGVSITTPTINSANDTGINPTQSSLKTGASYVGTTTGATVTYVAHGLSVGQSVIVTSAVNSAYNGTYRVLTTPTADTFTYNIDTVTSAGNGTLSWRRSPSLKIAGNEQVTGNMYVSGNTYLDNLVSISGTVLISGTNLNQSLTPSGSVISFAGFNAPVGWLKCNGSAVSRTTYSALFSVIGTQYGIGDGVTTFNLPELRGEFIRGLSDGRTGVDVNRILGSSQTDLLKKHKHITSNNDCRAYNSVNGTAQGVYNSWCDTGGVGNDINASLTGDGTHGIEYYNNLTANTSIGTVGDETRPRNIALLYIIKI